MFRCISIIPVLYAFGKKNLGIWSVWGNLDPGPASDLSEELPAPCLGQTVQREKCIGRAGGWTFDGFPSCFFLTVFAVQLKGRVAVGNDCFDAGRAENPV